MSAKSGKDFLLKYNTGTGESPTWTTLGGLRSRRMRQGREMIDVTTADAQSLHRLALSGGGVYALDVSGDGVFEDSAAQGAVERAAFTGDFLELQATLPGYGTYRFDAFVSDFEMGGDHNAELTFSATLMSSGEVTYAAL